MRVLIAGDFCPKNQLATIIEASDFSSAFGKVKEIITKVDYAIVNFESPVTQGNEAPIIKYGPNLRCTEKGIEAIKWAGFDCVTLANNHFLDYGRQGVENTLRACSHYCIDAVGGGVNLQEASKTLYREVAGKNLAIINCCEHEFSIATETTAGSNPLNPIQQYYAIQEAKNKAEYVLVIIHGGHEHYQLPSTRMQDLYRFFIDIGVDVVVNHHQHCFSGIEIYKGKPIFYGIGNFLFDTKNKNISNTWYEGYMVLLEFEEDNIKFEVVPYRQCSEELIVCPLSRKDEIDKFDLQLKKLCDIINDRKQLENCQAEYYAQKAKNQLSIFEPYYGWLPRAAYRRGFLPSFINKSLLVRAIDYTECESHYDILKFALKNKSNTL